MSTENVIKRSFRREVLNSVLSETPPEILYHYTDQTGLLGIIQSREIWATHHQCLNDTQEFLHAKALVRNEIDKLRGSSNSDCGLLLDAMRSALDGQATKT